MTHFKIFNLLDEITIRQLLEVFAGLVRKKEKKLKCRQDLWPTCSVRWRLTARHAVEVSVALPLHCLTSSTAGQYGPWRQSVNNITWFVARMTLIPTEIRLLAGPHLFIRPFARQLLNGCLWNLILGGSFNTIYEHVPILLKSDRNNRKFTYRPTSLPARIPRVNPKCLPDRKTLNRTWTVNETFHARTHFPPVWHFSIQLNWKYDCVMLS